MIRESDIYLYRFGAAFHCLCKPLHCEWWPHQLVWTSEAIETLQSKTNPKSICKEFQEVECV